jgi:hypothetical protein
MSYIPRRYTAAISPIRSGTAIMGLWCPFLCSAVSNQTRTLGVDYMVLMMNRARVIHGAVVYVLLCYADCYRLRPCTGPMNRYDRRPSRTP